MSDRAASSADDAEALLSDWFGEYAARTTAPPLHLLMRPRTSWRAVRAIGRLPVIRISPTRSTDGAAIRSALARPLLARLLLRGAVAALRVPNDSSAYTRGSTRKDLRQYIRYAERAGLQVHEVGDAERGRLLSLADERERRNPRAAFRSTSPDNSDMPGLRLWLVTRAAGGRPVLLTVVAVDGEAAMLRYHRTLDDSEDASLARYVAMSVLVTRLRELGARVLFERGQPQWLPAGLRIFQRRTGFRLVRVRLDRG